LQVAKKISEVVLDQTVYDFFLDSALLGENPNPDYSRIQKHERPRYGTNPLSRQI
jgi:hypothetical protein